MKEMKERRKKYDKRRKEETDNTDILSKGFIEFCNYSFRDFLLSIREIVLLI